MVPNTASADAGRRPIILIELICSPSLLLNDPSKNAINNPDQERVAGSPQQKGAPAWGSRCETPKQGNVRSCCLVYCKYELLFRLSILIISSSETYSRDSCVALLILKLCELNFSVGIATHSYVTPMPHAGLPTHACLCLTLDSAGSDRMTVNLMWYYCVWILSSTLAKFVSAALTGVYG